MPAWAKEQPVAVNSSANLSDDFTNNVTQLVQTYDTPNYNASWTSFLDNYFYGVITPITYGGLLFETTLIDDVYYQYTANDEVSGAASSGATFCGLMTCSENAAFVSAAKEVITTSVGANYTDGMSFAEWESMVLTNPGIISYILSPLSIWLHGAIFPELNAIILSSIADDYEAIWAAYAGNNTMTGCSEISTSNFALEVSLGDDSYECEYPTTSSYGGSYATITYCTTPGSPACSSPIQYNNIYNCDLACLPGSSPSCSTFTLT